MDKGFMEDASGFSALTQTTQVVLRDKMAAFEEFESATGKSLDSELTKEDYIQLFNMLGIRRSSYFGQCKMALVRYICYEIEKGVLPKEQESVISSVMMDDLSVNAGVDGGKKIKYIRNIADLRYYIEDTVKSALNYDDTLFDTQITAIYLMWFGFTEEEIVDVKKSDVLETGVMRNGELVEMPSYVMEVLHRYRDATGFYQQARGLLFHKYQYSEYLIRSERNHHLTRLLLNSSVSRFNAIMDGAYSLRYTIIHLSGVFNRVYTLECESRNFDLSNADFASKVFEEPLTDEKRRHMVNDYEHYKKLFR